MKVDEICKSLQVKSAYNKKVLLQNLPRVITFRNATV